MSPFSIYFTNFGILVPTGQPDTQVGTTQSKQRDDSLTAISKVNPLLTSILLLFRMFGSASGI